MAPLGQRSARAMATASRAALIPPPPSSYCRHSRVRPASIVLSVGWRLLALAVGFTCARNFSSGPRPRDAVSIAVVGTAAPPLTTNDPPLTTNDVVMYIPTTLNRARYATRVFEGSLKTWARVYESTPNRLFVISDDGAAARSRLLDHQCVSLDTPIVFEKHTETFRCSTTTVLLTDCVNAHWGGAGPCCKNEVALMHFARAFRDGLHPPRWMIFGEDDL